MEAPQIAPDLVETPPCGTTCNPEGRILVSQPPPWFVNLRIGNLRRADFPAFLTRVWRPIKAQLPAHKLVNVCLDRIEALR